MYKDNTYVYTNPKDHRVRIIIYKDGKTTSMSYPKYLIEQHLGRKLHRSEHVHHIDGNPENNDLDNLMVIDCKLHEQMHNLKYYDKIAVCDICHRSFIWTAKRQQEYYSRLRTHESQGIITCSKRCAGLLSAQTYKVRHSK